MIELADALKPGRQRDFCDGKLRGDDQVPGDQYAMRTRNFERRCPQVSMKEAPEMPRAYPQSISQLLEVPAIEHALGNKLERP